MNPTAPSRAIVDLRCYAHNLGVVRKLVGDNVAIAAVVKADAYGHGLLPLAQKALETHVAMLGVATVDEGLQLRKAGIRAPILVLFQPNREALAVAVAHRLTLMVCDVETARALDEAALKANKVMPIHCMIDTGMGRQGFHLETAPEQLQFLTRVPRIDIEGLATHFPVADKAEDPFTENQIRTFKQFLKLAAKTGIPFETAHAANSAAILNYPAAHFDLVRPGLMTYGVWPVEGPPKPGLILPVIRWETRVTQVKTLEAGSSVSYGRTYTTPDRMRAAVLPIGYADGYKHSLSNKADVLIRGVRCPVRGAVCMDQTVVEVTRVPDVAEGDIATLIGNDGDETVTVEELARHAGTIPYDILTGIGNRVPREYVA
ncbi:MAG TPA: alanine racemase [Candidatus Hydrogenedentes bacterium]|nr:alanine racemase [Candidatus Hydrogenedentota bacterium]